MLLQLSLGTVARRLPDGRTAAEFKIAAFTSAGFHDGFAERMAAAIPVTSEMAPNNEERGKHAHREIQGMRATNIK